MSSYITYNQVVDVLSDIARRHYQINTFFLGKDPDLENSEDIRFPLFQVYPTVARLPRTDYGEFKTIQINMNCKVVDLVQQSDDNLKDVHSDTLQIAQDIINEINQNPFFINSNFQVLNDIELENLEEFEDDYSAGWQFDLLIQLINHNEFCGLPFEPLNGISYNGADSTGYTYTHQFTCDDLIDCPIIIELGNDITQINSILSGLTGQTSYQYWVSGSTGIYSIKANNDSGLNATGDYSHAEGYGTIASGSYGSHAEGDSTTASGDTSHAEGRFTIALGYVSHSEGYNTTASGDYSHAEGYSTTASGSYGSHAEGYNTTASGIGSHAQGYSTTASGSYGSHAQGQFTIASGDYSHAGGYGTTASGIGSHAEGNGTIASGDYSYAEGYNTTASGYLSHAEGYFSTASGATSFVHGNYSIAGGTSTIVFGDNIIGTTANTVYVPFLNIKNFTGTTAVAGLAIDVDGNVVTGSTATLQQSYNNSSEPEIITNSSLGGITIKNGTGINNSKQFEIQNSAGITTMYVTSQGNLSGNSITAGTLTIRNDSDTFNTTISNPATANRTITLPNDSGTVILGSPGASTRIMVATSATAVIGSPQFTLTSGGIANLSFAANGPTGFATANSSSGGGGGAAISRFSCTAGSNTTLSNYGSSYAPSGLILPSLSHLSTTSSVGTLFTNTSTGTSFIWSIGGIATNNEVMRLTNTGLLIQSGVTANTYTVNQINGLTANTSQTVDLELSDQYEYTLSGNTTFTFSNNANGKSWMVAVKSNPVTSGYTSSFTASTASVKWQNGVTPTQTAAINKVDIYRFSQINGSIYGSYIQNF